LRITDITHADLSQRAGEKTPAFVRFSTVCSPSWNVALKIKAGEPAGKTSVLRPPPALSILGDPPTTFKGRKLGVPVGDGVDADLLSAVQAAFRQEGGMVKLVGRWLGRRGERWFVDPAEKIDGGPSVVFDAVAVAAGAGVRGQRKQVQE
jgi:hypothetical protein